MTLRKSFISKMVMAALLGVQISAPVKAADVDPHNPNAGMYDANHHGPLSHWWGHSHEVGEFHGYDGPVHDYNGYVAYTKEHVKKFETAILTNPHSAFEQLVAVANKNFSNTQNGNSLIQIELKYSTDLPAGQTTHMTLAPNSSEKVTLQLVVHPSMKKNPFVLLDALIALKNMYDINNIAAYEVKPIFHHHKKHPSHHHGPIIDYHYIDYSLQKSLGIPQEVFHYNPHTGQSSQLPALSPLEYMEVESNAKGGSVFAQRRLAELKGQNFQLFKRGLSTFTPITNLTEEQKKQYWLEYAAAKGVKLSAADPYEVSRKKLIDQLDLSNKKSTDALNAAATKTYKQQVQEYKAAAAEREVVVKTKSLPEMLKANDREGVAQAMEKMLPWSIMEPTEKSFWTDFVDSIRHPNYDNATILFRGLDESEKLQAVTDAKGKIVSGALLSKRLTAGSGSHLFKLKGLPETFETFGTNGVNSKKRISPLTQPHTLTKMMLNHASNPNGSPFISMSYDLQVALNFSSGKQLEVANASELEKVKTKYLASNQSGGLATIRIDPRRLIINSISGYIGELEVLASMFIFPDEVLYLEKGTNFSVMYKDVVSDIWSDKYKTTQVNAAEYYKRARQAVFEKTGVVMPENYTELKANGNTQFKVGINNMEALFLKVSGHKAIRCERVF